MASTTSRPSQAIADPRSPRASAGSRYTSRDLHPRRHGHALQDQVGRHGTSAGSPSMAAVHPSSQALRTTTIDGTGAPTHRHVLGPSFRSMTRSRRAPSTGSMLHRRARPTSPGRSLGRHRPEGRDRAGDDPPVGHDGHAGLRSLDLDEPVGALGLDRAAREPRRQEPPVPDDVADDQGPNAEESELRAGGAGSRTRCRRPVAG